MKTFLFEYESEGNLEKGPVVIKGENIGDAQDKFVEYLKKIGLWRHMWRLNFEAKEVKSFDDEIDNEFKGWL